MGQGAGSWESTMERLYYGNPYGVRGRSNGEKKHKEQILGPLECVLVNKLIQGSKCQVDAVESNTEGKGIKPHHYSGKHILACKGNLLYGGQGKTNTLSNNNCINKTLFAPGTVPDITDPIEGLKQPHLMDTGDVV